MAWLQGSTTWLNVDTDIAKLVCGEINDSLGANAGSDAWVRDISTAYNTIRTPASVDKILPAMSGRAGYWSLTGSGPGGTPGSVPQLTSCKQVAPIINTTAATHGRVLVVAAISTTNTVAGNYSTAIVSWRAMDADTGVNIQSSTVSLNSSGVATLYNGITVQFTDPTGILTLFTQIVRGFTGTYLYGIDFWPWHPFRSATTTWTTAPPGTAGTDYDFIDQVPASNVGFSSPPSAGALTPPGGFFSGMGCLTATAVNGAKYTTNAATVADQKLAIIKSVTPGAGVLDLIFGPAPLDSVASGGLRPSCCPVIMGWLKCAATPASVTNSMVIQYWISVKPTGIVIVLNADPGQSGKMGTAAVVKADTVTDTTHDFEPWYASNIPADVSSDQSPKALMWTRRSYFSELRCRDGSWGARDWQTGYMRTDFNNAGQNNWQYMWMGNLVQAVAYNDGTLSSGIPYYGSAFQNTAKPESNGFWNIYGIAIGDVTFNQQNIQGNPTVTWGGYFFAAVSNVNQAGEQNQCIIRATMVSHFGRLTGGSWSNGDELTDSVTGAKYFLVQPDYAGTWGRVRSGTNLYDGGTAIRENA